jgi:hypothetical protein
MIQSLLKHPIQYIFGIAGILFILLSMFSVEDITKLQVTFVEPVRLGPLVVGVSFVLLSLAWYVAPSLTVPLSWTALSKVKAISNGLRTTLAHARVEVCFGTVEDFFDSDPQVLVALPANDLFDDACIHDNRTSLGAFIGHTFPNQVHEICRLVRSKTKDVPKTKATEDPPSTPRYEIGTTLYFENPLNKSLKMAFLATTNITRDDGIRCEASNIFHAVKGLHRLVNTERLDSILLPVIGSGHGALHPSTSLICMLIAFAESLKEPSGRHIKCVRIVVHQKEKRAKPAIPRWQVRRLLAFVQRYCQAKEHA